MKRLRQEDISVYQYLKDIVLKEFFEEQENVPLIKSESLSSDENHVYNIDDYFEPSPKTRGRGFVYFDDLTNECLVQGATYSGTPEQSNRVTVYDAVGTVISDQEYVIDYVDCRIITTTADTVPASIDYTWNYVSLVDEWSTEMTPEPPVVVIDISETTKKGFQLGGGKKTIRAVSLYIFGSDTAERNDLIEVLYDSLYLKSCPLYEVTYGTVLDYDGLFTGRRSNLSKTEVLFDRTTVSGTSNIRFERVKSKNVSLPAMLSSGLNETMLSDLNAYRSRITFDIETYTE